MRLMVSLTLLLALAGAAQAGYLYNGSPAVSLSDPVDPALSGGRDILNVSFAQDASHYYFRISLREAPSYLGTNYAGIYGIYIDYQPGGANYGDTTYIPSGMQGVDYIVDTHFNRLGTNEFDGWDVHYGWNGTGFSIKAPVAQQETEDGGKTLELQILKSDIPATEFTLWAATHDLGSAVQTYDLAPDTATQGLHVPEPTTLAVLGLGGLAGLLRRRR